MILQDYILKYSIKRSLVKNISISFFSSSLCATGKYILIIVEGGENVRSTLPLVFEILEVLGLVVLWDEATIACSPRGMDPLRPPISHMLLILVWEIALGSILKI